MAEHGVRRKVDRLRNVGIGGVSGGLFQISFRLTNTHFSSLAKNAQCMSYVMIGYGKSPQSHPQLAIKTAEGVNPFSLRVLLMSDLEKVLLFTIRAFSKFNDDSTHRGKVDAKVTVETS